MSQEASESNEYNAPQIFFRENMAGKFSPRGIFVDTDNYLLDKIQSGPICELYEAGQFLDDKEIYEDVVGTVVNHIKESTIEVVMNAARRELEMCDGF